MSKVAAEGRPLGNWDHQFQSDAFALTYHRVQPERSGNGRKLLMTHEEPGT